jgi:release factor glutamine methyltransferase
MTVREALKNAEREFGRSEGEIILCSVLSCSRLDLLLGGAEPLSEEAARRIEEIAAERRGGRPLQYILGEAPFMDFALRVEEGVLIPRPETELLAEECIKLAPKTLLDLCTGSGCIAAAAARAGIRVTAADISDDALRVAAENLEGLGAELVKSDLFGALEGRAFEVIATNPPYIPSGDIEGLQPEVRDHEPRIALDGGADGLDIIRRIINEAPQYLKEGGLLLMEIGDDQGAEAVSLAVESGSYRSAQIIKDLAGKDRILRAQRI